MGESVQEAVLAEWFKQDGDLVEKDEPLLVIETDKVTMEIVAEVGGILKIMVSEGETVTIGAVVGSIEAGGEMPKAKSAAPEPKTAEPESAPVAVPPLTPRQPSPNPRPYRQGSRVSCTISGRP